MVTGPPPAQGPHVSSPSALPPGTRLGEFELLHVLGVGGFGIVYLALDHDLEREVAVKEYMPASLAGRTETLHVSLRSQSDAETFALGLRSFVNEARLLARFDHPSLLKVHRYWEANGTAYMAMPVLRGRTVKEVRQQMAASPDEAWLRALLDPLLGAIERLHAEGVYHRDIAPDNIQIEPDGRPVLLDFGAARRVIGDKSQTLTAILKPAYAPIEQYAEAGSVRQGPWTDLYALGATLHYLLLLRPPPPATARAVHDDAQPLATMQIAGCSPAFLQAIDWMLAPRPADRPQNVAELREVLAGRAPAPRRAAAEPPTRPWERTMALPPGAPDTATRVLPRSQPAARPTPPPSIVAPGGLPPAAPAMPQPAMSALPAPPAVRSRLVPVLLGLVVAAVISAVAFWPRPSVAPSMSDGAGQGAGQAAAPASPAPAPAAQQRAAPPAVVDAAASVPSNVPAVAATAPPPPTTTVATPAPATEAAPQAARDPVPVPPTTVVATPPTPARTDPGAVPARTSPAPVTARASAVAPARAAAPEPAPRPTVTPRPPPTAAVQAEAPRPREPARTAAEPTGYDTAPAAPPAVAAPLGAGAAPPAAEAPQAVGGPEARCAGRNPFSYFACMERECWRAEFQQHPDCMAWRKEARRR